MLILCYGEFHLNTNRNLKILVNEEDTAKCKCPLVRMPTYL